MKRRTFLIGAGAAAVALPVTRAFAQNGKNLSIVTSLPKELTDAYKAGFQKLHPDARVRRLTRNRRRLGTRTRECVRKVAA